MYTKKGLLAHARRAARRSRAKKVGHVIALKKSFFEGLRGAPMSKSGFTHCEDQTFDHGVWKDVCQRLYPRTLTALLNGQPTKMPKWMAARWKTFEFICQTKVPWTQKTNCQILAFATPQGLAKVKNDFLLVTWALWFCCLRCVAITQAGLYVFRAAGDPFLEEVIECNPPRVPIRPEGWEDEPDMESEDEVLMQDEAMAAWPKAPVNSCA